MTGARLETWWIAAGGRAYGPYTFERLIGFVGEGRLDGATLVSHEPDGPYAPAQSEPRIAERLADASARAKPVERTAAAAAQAAPTLKPADRASSRVHLVVAQFSSNLAAETFAATLAAIGERVDAAPGVWLVRSEADASVLRNRLSRGLATGERLIVVETTLERAAWFALGGDADRALRRLLEGARAR